MFKLVTIILRSFTHNYFKTNEGNTIHVCPINRKRFNPFLTKCSYLKAISLNVKYQLRTVGKRFPPPMGSLSKQVQRPP